MGLDSATDPGSSQADQRRLDDRVVVDKIVAVGLIFCPVNSTTKLRKNYHAQVGVFDPHRVPWVGRRFLGDPIGEWERIDPATRSLNRRFSRNIGFLSGPAADRLVTPAAHDGRLQARDEEREDENIGEEIKLPQRHKESSTGFQPVSGRLTPGLRTETRSSDSDGIGFLHVVHRLRANVWKYRHDLELPSVGLPNIPLIRILTPCSRCLGGKFDCSVPSPSFASYLLNPGCRDCGADRQGRHLAKWPRAPHTGRTRRYS